MCLSGGKLSGSIIWFCCVPLSPEFVCNFDKQISRGAQTFQVDVSNLVEIWDQNGPPPPPILEFSSSSSCFHLPCSLSGEMSQSARIFGTSGSNGERVLLRKSCSCQRVTAAV